jgi:hypothetical protein
MSTLKLVVVEPKECLPQLAIWRETKFAYNAHKNEQNLVFLSARWVQYFHNQYITYFTLILTLTYTQSPIQDKRKGAGGLICNPVEAILQSHEVTPKC